MDSGSTTFIDFCPICDHARCQECTIYTVEHGRNSDLTLRPRTTWQPSREGSSSFRNVFNSQPRNNLSDSPDYGERVQVEDKAYNIAADQLPVDPKPQIITKPPDGQGKLNTSEGSTLINPARDIDKPPGTDPTGPVSQSSRVVETTNASTPGDHHHSSGGFSVTKDIEFAEAAQDLQFSQDGRATSSGYQIIKKEANFKNAESESDDISSRLLVTLGADFGSCDKCGILTSCNRLSCDRCNVTNQSDRQKPKIAPNISRSSSPDSIAESVFSGITDSSISSLGAPDGANERFIALLLGDIVIKENCKNALTWLEPDKFEKKLQRLLTQLASELRREAETKLQRHAARFVKCYARNSAYIICHSLQKDFNTQPSSSKGKSDSNSDTDDSDSGHSENELDDLNQLEAFIKNSKAFKDFVDKVEKFVCASIDVAEAIDRIFDVPISNPDPAAVPEHDNDAMEQNRTKGIVTGVEPAHNRPIWLSPLHSMIFWIAISVGTLIVWMAAVLKSRRPQLAEGKTRIEWTCVSGSFKYREMLCI